MMTFSNCSIKCFLILNSWASAESHYLFRNLWHCGYSWGDNPYTVETLLDPIDSFFVVWCLDEVLSHVSTTAHTSVTEWSACIIFSDKSGGQSKVDPPVFFSFFSYKLSLSKIQTLLANMLNNQATIATTTVNLKANTDGSVCTGQ